MLGRFNRVIPRSPFNKIQYRTFFIKTENTPNPQSLKFIPTAKVVLPEEHGTGMHFERNNIALIKRSKLVRSIFELKGIKSVFLRRDFVSITKDGEKPWRVLKPEIFVKMLDFWEDDEAKILEDETEQQISDTTILDTDSEITATIKE